MSMVDNYTHFESTYKNHMQEASPVLEQVELLRNALETFRVAVAERERGTAPDFPDDEPTLELRNALEKFRDVVAEQKKEEEPAEVPALEEMLALPAIDVALPVIDIALLQTAIDEVKTVELILPIEAQQAEVIVEPEPAVAIVEEPEPVVVATVEEPEPEGAAEAVVELLVEDVAAPEPVTEATPLEVKTTEAVAVEVGIAIATAILSSAKVTLD